MDAAYLGLDVGTQALKAVAVNDAGRILWSTSVEYPTRSPKAGWAEQSPEDWRLGLDEALRRAAGLAVAWKGVGITGQMHTLTACDGSGRPLRPAILWSDQRTASYVEDLVRIYGEAALNQWTANAPLTNFSILRLLWMRDYEPELYQQIRRVAVAKDWVRFTLTGEWATDVTDASGTYVFNVAKRQWAYNFMDALQIPSEWWSRAAESDQVVGTVRYGPECFRGVPVGAGAGDQAASAIGTGLEAGELGLSLGTSGVLFWILERFVPPPDPSVHCFCHAQRGAWHWMTVTQSAALSMRWLRDRFYPSQPYAAIDEEASSIPVGSKGLLFWPYLNGERAPIMQPGARGGFSGLSMTHGRAHLARAVLEGVAFSQKHCVLAMNERGDVRPRQVVMTGGGSQSVLWSHMMADVLDCPVAVSDDPGAAVGAAWLARNAVHKVNDRYPRAAVAVREPNSEAVERYAEAFQRYRAVVERLVPIWDSPR